MAENRGAKKTGKNSHINNLATILGLDVLFSALFGPPGPQIDTKRFSLSFCWPPDPRAHPGLSFIPDRSPAALGAEIEEKPPKI